jgi:hypothetical protein
MKNQKTNTTIISKGGISETVAKVESANFEQFKKAVDLHSIEKITVEKVENAIALFNELAKEQKTVENLYSIEKMLVVVNNDSKNSVVDNYINLNHFDLVKALASVKISVSEKDTPQKIVQKIKNGVSYEFYKIVEKDNLQTLATLEKSVTIDDIIERKAQFIANKRADNEKTKDDTKKAKEQVFNDTIKGSLYCALHCACVLEKINDTKVKHTPEFLKMSKVMQTYFDNMKKENPFTKTSRNALEQQLKMVVGACLNCDEYDNKIRKEYADLFVKMLVTVNSGNGLQKELQNDNQLLQALIIICRYMYNEIKPQYKHNKTIHTTK